MRSVASGVLLLTTVCMGVYMYTLVEAVCKAPVTYRLGHIDERFNISTDEVRLVVGEAESVWEQATGRNLFTYDPTGELVISFIFDERQQLSDAETVFRSQLDAAADVNSTISATYETLTSEYNKLDVEYKNKVAAYEQRLTAYNTKVATYNNEGGAPPDVYAELDNERIQLDSDADTINTLGKKLNGLVAEINKLSEQGNKLIENYNQDVTRYNKSFGDSREFTQGDYQDGKINIYKFSDMTELRLVLAHELGHALSLDHVIDESAVMHRLLGEQPEQLRLTEDDLDEFERICGRSTRSWIERLMILLGV